MGIHFDPTGNVKGTTGTDKGGTVKQKNTAVLPNLIFANYFNKSASVQTQTQVDPRNETLEGLKGHITPAAYKSLHVIQQNFESVPELALRNKNQDNLVISDADFMPDAEYADLEV